MIMCLLCNVFCEYMGTNLHRCIFYTTYCCCQLHPAHRLWLQLFNPLMKYYSLVQNHALILYLCFSIQYQNTPNVQYYMYYTIYSQKCKFLLVGIFPVTQLLCESFLNKVQNSKHIVYGIKILKAFFSSKKKLQIPPAASVRLMAERQTHISLLPMV